MFALTLLNVLTLFALVGCIASFVLVNGALMRRFGRTWQVVPLAIGLAAAWSRTGGLSWRFAGIALVSSVFALVAIAFVSGWLLRNSLDQRETKAGRPRIGPVLVAWSGCLAFAGVIAFLNHAQLGDARFWPVAVQRE